MNKKKIETERYNGRNWHGSNRVEGPAIWCERPRTAHRAEKGRLLNAAAQFNEPPGFSRNVFAGSVGRETFDTVFREMFYSNYQKRPELLC